MKRLIPIILLISLSFVTSAQTGRELFFSEYMEGSQNNKALEIFNPGPSTADLSKYRIAVAVDGADWSVWKEFAAGNTLKSDSVWTLVNDQFTQVGFDIETASEKIFSYEIPFGGNDAIGLFLVSASDTSLIDIIGTANTGNPGSGWDVAGVLSATANHTLVRKSMIDHGNVDWSISAGNSESSSEWIVKNTNFVDSLGHHFFRPLVYITDIKISSSASTTIETDKGTIQLSSEILPSNATETNLLWTSSEPYAISVSQSGLVLALNNGSAWIKASSTDGSGVADSIKITASNQTFKLPVSSITVAGLDGEDTISNNKGSLLMIANIIPVNATNKEIIWTVDQPEIAEITSTGLLTAKKNGKVLVTAASQDGSAVFGTKVIVILGQYSEVPNLKALRAAYNGDGTVYRLAGEVVLSHWVYNRNTKFVQDDEAGIVIDDEFAKITTVYKIGDGITGLTGYMEDDIGMLQFHPIEDPGAVTAENKIITPIVLTVKEFNDNFEQYESRLVKLDHLKFDQPKGVFEVLTNYTVHVGSDISVMRTEFANADYLGEQIPDSANITGMAIQLNTTPKIAPRKLDDIEVLPLINSINLLKTPFIDIFPNPVTTELHLRSVHEIMSYEIIDQSGRIVISGKTEGNKGLINLQNLSSGFYFVRFYGDFIPAQMKFIKQ